MAPKHHWEMTDEEYLSWYMNRPRYEPDVIRLNGTPLEQLPVEIQAEIADFALKTLQEQGGIFGEEEE